MLLAIHEGEEMKDIVSLSDPTGRSDSHRPILDYYPSPTPTDLQTATQEEVEKVSE